MSDTAPVTITVLAIEPLTAGRLIGLAAVEIIIDGIGIVLQGVRIERSGPHVLTALAPTFRDRTGTATPAVILPPELGAAIASAVLDEFQAMRRAIPSPEPRARARGHTPCVRGSL